MAGEILRSGMRLVLLPVLLSFFSSCTNPNLGKRSNVCLPSRPTPTSYGRAMMIASLNAQQSIMLVRRKPSTTTTSITRTSELIDEDRRPMTTLRGIKEKGRRLECALSEPGLGPCTVNKTTKKKPHHRDAFWDWGTGANSMSGFSFIIFLLF